jgi:hypothetical protein
VAGTVEVPEITRTTSLFMAQRQNSRLQGIEPKGKKPPTRAKNLPP